MGYIWPVNDPVTQEFGANPNPSYQPGGHTGMDFACTIGTPVRATAAGTVLHADWAQALGWPNPYYVAIDFDGPANGDQSAGILVIIDHGPGQPASIYGHLSETLLNNGDKVAQGQVIGLSGMTGRSTGPHLHFEFLPDAWDVHTPTYGRVNPRNYIDGVKDATNVIAGNQRIAVGNVNPNQRSAPKSDAPIVRVIQAGSAEVFDGYVRGEPVGGVDTWYKDVHGYVWAGNFNDHSTNGLPDLTPAAPAALEANQRVTVAEVNKRTTPNLHGDVTETFPADSILTFTGFVYGENVGGNNVWFVGISGQFLWSGNFADHSTNGLPDLTPAPAPVETPVAGNQRVTNAGGARYRKAPKSTADLISAFDADLILTLAAWTRGENYDNNDVWFKGVSGGYLWSGAFTDTGTHDLPEEVSTPPSPTPAPVAPAPAADPVYDFVADFDFVEKIPAHYNNVQRAIDNPGIVVFPPAPKKAVIHQFGTLGIDTVGSTINQFRNGKLGLKASSAHFVVSGKRIIQMVSLKDRAYHAYTFGNEMIGIETDPAQDADTIASTKRLLMALKAKYGYTFVTIRHKDVPECRTNCGTLIDLSKYDITASVVVPPAPVPTPTPVPLPTPTPAPIPVADKAQIISEYQKWQLNEYLKLQQ